MSGPVVPEVLDVDTPLGPGRFHLHAPMDGAPADGVAPAGLVVLGHGAGGGVKAPDLVAATAAAISLGWTVALFEQPWKVAGKRVATRPPTLDVAWLAAVPQLLEQHAGDWHPSRGELRLVVGGRSAGARVACRTAAELGAAGVLCLAFPLHLPGKPEKSRGPELASAATAGIPALVVQGERDPFGTPDELRALIETEALTGVRLVPVPGDHSLKAQVPVRDAVTTWLPGLRSAGRTGPL